MSAFVNPTPGDIQYAQYAVVDTVPIKADVTIEKGHCYTMNADGYLVAFTGTGGALTNLNEVFQAMASSEVVTSEADGDRRVQCLQKRSRILMKAAAHLTKGDTLTIDVAGAVVTADKVQHSTSHIIGTVFEIASITSARIPKVKTVLGDFVIVDLIR